MKKKVLNRLCMATIMASCLNLTSQIVRMGCLSFDSFIKTIPIGIIVALCIALFLPLQKTGIFLAKKFKIKKSSKKSGIIVSAVYSLQFSLIMSLTMCFANVILLMHLTATDFLFAWLKVIIPSYIVAFIISSLIKNQSKDL